jgi:hypothetical protein
MARLQKSNKNGLTYLYIVEDDYSTGERKVKSIKSYGILTPEKLIEAEMFLVNYNKLDDMAKQKIREGESYEGLKKVLKFGGYLALGVLGAKALQFLFDKYLDRDD